MKIIYKGPKEAGGGKQFFICEEPVKELRDGRITLISLDKDGLPAHHWLGTEQEAKQQFEVIKE